MADDMFYLESLRRYGAIYVTQRQYPEANWAFYKAAEGYKNLGALKTRADLNALADYANSWLFMRQLLAASIKTSLKSSHLGSAFEWQGMIRKSREMIQRLEKLAFGRVLNGKPANLHEQKSSPSDGTTPQARWSAPLADLQNSPQQSPPPSYTSQTFSSPTSPAPSYKLQDFPTPRPDVGFGHSSLRTLVSEGLQLYEIKDYHNEEMTLDGALRGSNKRGVEPDATAMLVIRFIGMIKANFRGDFKGAIVYYKRILLFYDSDKENENSLEAMSCSVWPIWG